MAHPRPPPPLLEWDDARVIMIFARAPFFSHGSIRCVCRRLRTLLESPSFREERLESGYAEHGIVACDVSDTTGQIECWLLVGRRWRSWF